MIALANFALLFLLSITPGQSREKDPHGLFSLAQDSHLRAMLLEGRFDEFNSVVDGFLGKRLSMDFDRSGRRVSPTAVRGALNGRPDFAGLLGSLKSALAVACFAVELKTLGPAEGLKTALSWVETGLLRKSGLRQKDFPSLFGILGDPARAALDAGELRGIDRDLFAAKGSMNSAYLRIFGQLQDSLF